jgi:hypothetical protein
MSIPHNAAVAVPEGNYRINGRNRKPDQAAQQSALTTACTKRPASSRTECSAPRAATASQQRAVGVHKPVTKTETFRPTAMSQRASGKQRSWTQPPSVFPQSLKQSQGRITTNSSHVQTSCHGKPAKSSRRPQACNKDRDISANRNEPASTRQAAELITAAVGIPPKPETKPGTDHNQQRPRPDNTTLTCNHLQTP